MKEGGAIMICPNCGAYLNEGTEFCETCGTFIPVEKKKPDEKPEGFSPGFGYQSFVM